MNANKLLAITAMLLLTPLIGSAAEKPNVVFIFADDLGYGEIEALNPERSKIPTPSLNQIAAEGMVFTDAHTSSSVCTPSRYALLTGRYNWRSPLQKGVMTGGQPPLIAADRLTLGKLFHNQGYETALIGKWHLGYSYETPENLKSLKREKSKARLLAPAPIGAKVPDGPVTRGFDSFFGFHEARSMSSVVRNDTIVEEIDVIDMLPRLTKEAVSYIDQHAAASKTGKPFFLYFPLSSPHTPIVPAEVWEGKGKIGTYADFVAQTDGTVGEVLKALDRNGLSENTIVFFSCDNGTSKAAGIPGLEKQGHYPSANLRGSKADLWDGGHRVPFIVRWPGHVQPKSHSDQLVCLTDMMATFGEMFGVKYADNEAEDSISFLPALYDKPIETPRIAVVHHSIDGCFSIRQGEWKLLLAPGSGGWSSPKDTEAIKAGLPQMQLYNMNTNIGETENLLKTHADKIAELLALLETYVENGRSTPGATQQNDAEIDLWKKERWQSEPVSKQDRPEGK